MSENDDLEFASRLAGLAEMLGEAISQTRIKGYFAALAEYDFQDVSRAINQAAKECKFFPKPVELIELIEGSKDSHAAKAWQLLTEAVQQGGYYSSLYVEDHALALAIRRTFESWLEIANNLPGVADPMYASLYNRFRAAYQAARRSGEQSERYFVGWHEAQNRQNVATWQIQSDAEPVYPQKVLIIAGGKVFESRLLFSKLTGALTEGSQRQLIEGTAKPALIKAAALPPARMIEGDYDPAEVRAAMKRLAS